MTHTVLIADDEPNIVISLEFLMKREGHRVLVARDGAQALEAIRRDRPDLVLLDVMMPVLTGFEVCQQVRADESLAGTKILLLTAKGRDTDVAQGLGLGADGYMTKPFSTKDLAARVRQMLARCGVRVDVREVAAAVAPAVVLALWAGGGAAAFIGTLDAAERSALLVMLESRVALVVMGWMVASIALGVLTHRLWGRSGAATARLAEQAQVLAGSDMQRELALPGDASVQAVQAVINQLVRQRAALKTDVDERVRQASRDIDAERSRLAALMAELTQSVVVCNLDGRILLYNSRARLQFRALSDAGAAGAGGAELLGIGRSIYGVFDRQLVAHALDGVQQRLQRGATNPSTQFVTSTRGGQLLRVQMAPVRAMDDSHDTPVLSGFVLMLDNITRDFADESERDRMLHQLTETSRASLGNLQAAVELLDDPGLDADTRERFQGVVRDEVAAMSRRIQDVAQHTTQTLKTRWPLEDMRGDDLVQAAARRIEQLYGCRTASSDVDTQLWLKVDSFSLLQALAYLAGRLVDEYGIKLVELRLQVQGQRAQARPGVDRPGDEHRERDGLGDRRHQRGRPDQRADGARRGAAPRRCLLVRARTGAPRGVLPLPAAAGGRRRGHRGQCAAARRQPTRVLRLRPLRGPRRRRRAGGPQAHRTGLHRFRHRDHRPEPESGRRDHPDRRHPASWPPSCAGRSVSSNWWDPQRDIPAAGIPIHGITPDRVAGQPVLAQGAAGLPRLCAGHRAGGPQRAPSTCASCS